MDKFWTFGQISRLSYVPLLLASITRCGLFSDNDISKGLQCSCSILNTLWAWECVQKYPIPNRQYLVWQCTKLCQLFCTKSLTIFFRKSYFNLFCPINNRVLNHLMFLWGKVSQAFATFPPLLQLQIFAKFQFQLYFK